MHCIIIIILSMNVILSSVDANYCTIQYDVYSRKKIHNTFIQYVGFSDSYIVI